MTPGSTTYPSGSSFPGDNDEPSVAVYGIAFVNGRPVLVQVRPN